MTTVHPLCLLLAPFFRACGGIGWNLWCDVTKGPLISEQHHLPDFSTALSFSFFVLCCECRHKRAVLWWFVDIFVCNQSCKAAPLESGMKNRSKEVRTRDLYAALRPKKRASYLAMRRPWRMFILICRGGKHYLSLYIFIACSSVSRSPTTFVYPFYIAT